MSKCPKCIKALKTYNTEVKKEKTFNFTATQVMGTVEDPREDLVKKAVTCTIPSIDFKTADFAGGTGVYTKLSDKITFDAFTEAGKYEYTVKESASDPVINAESKYEKLGATGDIYFPEIDKYEFLEAGDIVIPWVSHENVEKSLEEALKPFRKLATDKVVKQRVAAKKAYVESLDLEEALVELSGLSLQRHVSSR